MPSYVKDTNDFLRKLDAIKYVPDNAYLVSLDVKSLYPSIPNPNAEGIKAVKDSFDKHTSKNVTTKVITFLALIIALTNLCSFANTIFKEKALPWLR